MKDRQTTQLREIKLVCSNYFQKYDGALDDVREQQQVANSKYESWSKVLIEPTSFNDARLYALETRFNEEEEMRFQQMESFKDMLKKLIFTLE